jgi:hypothetical protein
MLLLVSKNFVMKGSQAREKRSAMQAQLDFVYETTVSKEFQDAHRRATVLNRLNGTVAFEDKVRQYMQQCS